MFAKIREIEQRYDELERHLSLPEIIKNQGVYRKYIKEHSMLTPIISNFRKYESVQHEIENNLSLIDDPDPEMRKLVKEEIDSLSKDKTFLVVTFFPSLKIVT